MPLDGTRGVHPFLGLGIEKDPVGSAFTMSATTAPRGKLDHLGMREKIQTAQAKLRIELDPPTDEDHTHRRVSFFRNFVMLHKKWGKWVSFSKRPPWYSLIQERKNSRWASEYGNHHQDLNVNRPTAGRLM